VLLLLIIAATTLWITKPWVPDIEQTAPGPGGNRVTIGSTGGGNIGNYYPGPAGQRSPAILVLGGSEGGLGAGADGRARALNAAGYAVLALSWYRLPGQPERLELVPLETFYAGLDWLAARPDVDPARIAMFGTSKGAEAALLVAARRPAQVRAVVAAMPSHVIWQGFDWSMMPVNASSWSEGGRPIPYLPITTADWSGDIYGPALASLPRHQNAIIPVERITGAVLLACGEADSLWPSCRMARAVQDRRALAGGLTTELLAYADAGHGGHGPPVAPGTPAAERIASLGGTIGGNIAARDDGWPRTLAFLAAALAPENAQ
jgi:uncharacterized protein